MRIERGEFLGCEIQSLHYEFHIYRGTYTHIHPDDVYGMEWSWLVIKMETANLFS